MPLKDGGDRPDRFEKGVRFGCGFILGLAVGLWSATQIVFDTWGAYAIIVLVLAVACGILALRYGDAFWSNLRHWL